MQRQQWWQSSLYSCQCGEDLWLKCVLTVTKETEQPLNHQHLSVVFSLKPMQWNLTSLKIQSCEWTEETPEALSLGSCYFSHWLMKDRFILVYDCRGPLMNLGYGWHVGVHVLEGCGRILLPHLIPGSRECRDTYNLQGPPLVTYCYYHPKGFIAFKMVSNVGPVHSDHEPDISGSSHISRQQCNKILISSSWEMEWK